MTNQMSLWVRGHSMWELTASLLNWCRKWSVALIIAHNDCCYSEGVSDIITCDWPVITTTGLANQLHTVRRTTGRSSLNDVTLNTCV